MQTALPSVESIFQTALQHHRAGRLAEAEAAYRQVLARQPGHAQGLHLLAVLLHGRGESAAAVPLLEAAIRIRPAAEYRNALGQALTALGRYEEALDAYGAALASEPASADVKSNMAVTLLSLGRAAEALEALRAAITLRPGFVEAHYNLGNALTDLGRLAEAADSYAAAIALRDPFPEARVNLGNVLRLLGRHPEALEQYHAALAQRPGFPEALCNMGNALAELGRDAEALEAFQAALAQRPDYAEALSNIGNVLYNQGRLEEGLAACRAAIAAQPNSIPAHCNSAVILLLQGNMAEGWPEFEWRFFKHDFSTPQRDFGRPRWMGEDIAGKTILLHHEQGLGDSIQFVRYVPEVLARGARVVLEMPPMLHALFAPFRDRGVTIVRTGDPLPPFDVHCPMLSLPLAFRTVVETVPATVPYLQAEPARVAAWRARLPGSGFRVGIVWQGKPNIKIDEGRSIPLAAYAPLARIPGVTLVSLQKNHGLDQLDHLPEGMVVHTLGDDFDSGPDAFLDTAAVMMGLDLVITSDTSIAHLAGALGRPAWVALKSVPEWRFMIRGEDSPWYPTLRLFRQTVRGDWPGVFARMAQELAAVVAGDTARLAPAERLWTAGTGDAAVPVAEADCRHGRLRFLRHDRFIGRSLADYGEWSDAEVAVCGAVLRPGDTVVEVGSNIGAHTLALARRVGETGRVHAFEPQEVVFGLLSHNIAANGLDGIVRAHRQAVGARPGSIKVPPVDYAHPGNFGGVAMGGETGQDVPLVTIDSLGLERLRLLKVDAEGAEYDIVQGARDTIARCRPVLYLENEWRNRSEDFTGLLRDLGYEIWWHFPPLYSPANFRANPLNLFPRVISSNMLCLPREMDCIVVGLTRDVPGVPVVPTLG